ncbi:MAG: universal stress protein [Proteobacteria bacterium]|nr:universal stress protein [Pseudomonadota bacterium]
MFKKILVATDGSTLSRKAEKCAIDMARTHQAELLVVNVVPRYPLSYFEGAARFSAQEIGAIESRWSHEAQDLLERVAQRANALGVKTRTAAISSDLVAQALLLAARKHKCDLIVMASHGRKGIKRLLLGSETQHVLTHSTLPVLVLR